MLTDEGRFMIGLILFLFGIFACGYFIGWSRNKLSIKIFDQMLTYHERARHWQGRFHETQTNYYDLMKEHKELKAALTLIGDVAYDRDGYTGNAKKLEVLVDEIHGYARNPQTAVDTLKEEK